MTEEEWEAVYSQFEGLYDDREALLDAVTDATLQALRVPVKLLGYQYIFLGARYILSRPSNEHPSMLKDIYPATAEEIELIGPDEHFRRLGQSVAAAQIPVIKKGRK